MLYKVLPLSLGRKFNELLLKPRFKINIVIYITINDHVKINFILKFSLKNKQMLFFGLIGLLNAKLKLS